MNLMSLADAARDAGVTYIAAYNAWMMHSFEVTRIRSGKRHHLYLDSDQLEAFGSWVQSATRPDASTETAA